MKKIELPREVKGVARKINKDELIEYLSHGASAPSIKEQLILTAYDIADKTKVFYESETLIVLSSYDQTGTYLSCINKIDTEISVEIPLVAMGLLGHYIAYCVLTGEEIGILDDTLVVQVQPEGMLLIKLLPIKNN